MHVVTIEGYKGNWRATATLADKMFDDDCPRPVFGYGRDPDTAMDRLLSDYPEVSDYRIISRDAYEALWD